MKCESCNSQHDGSFATGRFCNRACANRRHHSKEVYDKIRTTHPEERKCKHCNKIFVTKNTSKQIYCGRSCQVSQPRNYSFESKMRQRKAASESAKRRYASNDSSIGWQSRTKLKASYPEKYFISLFEKENIEYIREVKCNKYFIDFVLPGKLAIEIDGRHHEDSAIKIKDIQKDNVLRENGYEIIRIKWYNPITDNSKKKLYEQINALLVKVATRVFGKDEKSDRN